MFCFLWYSHSCSDFVYSGLLKVVGCCFNFLFTSQHTQERHDIDGDVSAFLVLTFFASLVVKKCSVTGFGGKTFLNRLGTSEFFSYGWWYACVFLG